MVEATCVEPDHAPADRPGRNAVLERYRIVDAGPEVGFDDVVLLASQVCETSAALVAFVDGGREWFKARVGFALSEMPLAGSLCRHALAHPGLLVIPDLAADPRTRADALVIGEPHIRFYAAARLETPQGLVLGTLCVMDPKPRPIGLTPAQAAGLQALARQVMTLMELHRAASDRDGAVKAAREGDVRRRQILESATDYAIVAMDRGGVVTEWNAGAQVVFGWSAAEMVGDTVERFFTPEDRAVDRAGHEMRHALLTGKADDARWHLRKDGSRFWANGEMMPLRDDGGEHVGFLKIVRDETERRAAAERQRAEQEFMRSVLASSNDCIKVLDLEANLVFMSEGGQRVMEVSDFNAIRGCPWPDFWQGDLAAEARAAVAAGKAGRLGHFQGPANTMAGTPKYWDVRVTPILDATGEPAKLLSISRDITDAHRAQDALREAQGLNTLILNSSSDCIVVLDLDGHTQFVSPGGIEAMEISDVDAIIGLSWLRVWTGADNAAARAALAEARAGGTGHFQGFCATHKGRPKWWDVAISPVRGSDGRPERLVSVGRDITERKQAEVRRLALLDLGDRLRDMQDAAEMAVVAAEIMGAALDADRAGYGTVDEAAETLAIERGWTASGVDRIAGLYAFREFGSFVDDLRQGSTVAISDVRRDPRTGSYASALEAIGIRSILNIPLFEHGIFVALFYVHGAGVRAWEPEQVAFARNVADRARAAIERRRAEIQLVELNRELERRVDERTRALTQSEARLQAYFSASPEYLSVVRLSAEGDLVYDDLNPACEALFGLPRADVVGRTPQDVLNPQSSETVETYARECLRTGRTLRYEVERKFGTLPRMVANVVVTPVTLPDAGVALVLFCGRDLTQQRRAEEQLRQSQKMEAIGQLTGGVAHDFNNLLTVIRSSVDLLKRPGLSDERRRRYIDAISDTTTRAAKLTGQLLAFARRQALKPEVFDVGRSVRTMGDTMVTLMGSRIRIEIDVPEEACLIDADPSQFDTALVNLAVNARDAMGGEGRLTIGMKAVSLVPAMRGSPAMTGGFVAVSMTDTGSGIAEADMAVIFEPFFTTKPAGQGTGLGLSQVFGFVKQSGGEVGVSSEIGQGTTFTLYLPRVDGPVAEGSGAGLAEPVVDGHGTVVLVVEDNADVGSFATETLKELGYRSVLAHDAQSALVQLDEDADRFDVVFSDVVMPGMNGIDLATEIRARHPDLPVILTSGYSHVLAQNGTYGFELLQKPYSIEQLSRVLRKAARWRQLKRVLNE